MQHSRAVFVAHEAGDSWIARQMAGHIERLGIEVFVDVVDLEHGDDFERRIVEAAHDADEMAVLLTPWSIARPFIWMEIGMFLALDKRIVGVLYRTEPREVRANADVPSTIKRLHLVRLDDFEAYLHQLSRRANDHEE